MLWGITMNSTVKHSRDREVLDEVRSNGKQWRRLVSRCTESTDLVPPDTEEQYKVVHGRILASCRSLADEESLPEFRRRVALQLDELLRPWSSAKSLSETPPHLVQDLLAKETSLEDRLRGKRRFAMSRLKKLAVVAAAASVAGIAIVLFMEWAGSAGAQPLFNSLSWIASSIVIRLQESTFTEQFAVAVLFSWLFGTWLLSKVPSG
jgi:hypothetical protein